MTDSVNISKTTICIPLLGKGATNHLHRQMIVDELVKRGFAVLFLVREDYVNILNQLQDCTYKSYTIPESNSVVEKIVEACRYFRRMYHPSDPWVKVYNDSRIMQMPRMIGKLWARFIILFAKSKCIMRLVSYVEGILYRYIGNCHDLDELEADQLLIMSSGTYAQAHDIRLTWWAYRLNKPVVHVVGNYDSLSSHGYRGFPVKRLLVWGSQMAEDAEQRHGIPASHVRQIGSLRYNMMPSRFELSRDSFLESIGFDPSIKTIVFGGSNYEYHYFEILRVFEILKMKFDTPLQLIIRVYPTTSFLDSPFLHILLAHISTLKDVWVSNGDPNFRDRKVGKDVIEIDEKELWQLLNASDVVVNLFSTLALEACLFDKPVIHMWYFLPQPRCLVQPVYFPTNHSLHNVRAIAGGAVTVARSREELVNQVIHVLHNAASLKEYRKSYVDRECGLLDGFAASRLADNCVEILKGKEIKAL